MSINKKLLLPTIAVWTLIFIYSFTQRDLNLTIYNFPGVQIIQEQLSYIGYFQRPVSTLIFTILIGLSWYTFLQLIKHIKTISYKQIFTSILVIAILGILSYPLFSHDIFNYLFNAKMVLVYHVNPHIQTANQFMQDDWTRFMHNVHTAAPYGYGWTAASLLPLLVTIKNFTLSFWSMKLFVILFFLFEAFLIYQISHILFPKRAKLNTLLFTLNPLFIMETFFIGHNDSAMMAFALLSLYLLLRFDKNKRISTVILSVIALALSFSVKYATIVLAPFILLRKKFDVFTWGGFALLAVLLTRPGQLHSWYLQWGLTMLILSKYKWSRAVVTILSFAGMLRYLPFIYYGNWDPPVPLQRWMLLLAPLSLLLIKKFRMWFNNA